MSPIATQVLVAFAFGVTFIAILILLAIKVPKPEPFQYNVFRTVLSLAAAGVAAMVPGFVDIQVSPTAKLLIRAGGALAVFLIVFFRNPAKLAAHKQTQDSDGTLFAARDEGGRVGIVRIKEYLQKHRLFDKGIEEIKGDMILDQATDSVTYLVVTNANLFFIVDDAKRKPGDEIEVLPVDLTSGDPPMQTYEDVKGNPVIDVGPRFQWHYTGRTPIEVKTAIAELIAKGRRGSNRDKQ